MNRKLQVIKYLIADLFTATSAWCLFYIFRKVYLESQKFGHTVHLEFNQNFFIGLALIPLFWLCFYAVTGTYRHIYRKSRLKELGQTLLISLIGVTIIFFALLLDDEIATYKSYYSSFSALYLLHFFLTFICRFIISSSTAHKIHNRIIGFNTLIIGSNAKALKLYNELEAQQKSTGFKLLGFVHINGNNGHLLKDHLPHLGHFDNLTEVIKTSKIEEVIIAIESSEHDSIGKIINALEGKNVFIKIIPGMYDILSGSVKMSSIFGAPLIAINHEIMPPWQQSLKRLMDIFISLFVMIVFAPLYFILAICVKLSSAGPVLYNHERIGKYGKPFIIYKFRSMYKNAENNGPALSHQHDSRITKFGKFMRRTRLDELPQFYNVLIGDMSLVGPRPERQHYIDLITERAPHYAHLQKVTPGITSWGQVKYGYAENVDQMIERLKFDIIYIENMSLFVDFKIIIYTVLIVLRGSGK